MKQGVTFRRARREDIPALATLATRTYIDSFGDMYSPALLAALIERGRSAAYFERCWGKNTVVVAEEDGEPVGYTQFGAVTIEMPDLTDSDQELCRLYVLAGYQGQGIGSSLMDLALNHPRMINAAKIYLDVWEHNDGAVRLYKRYGFKTIARNAFVVGGKVLGYYLIMVRKAGSRGH